MATSNNEIYGASTFIAVNAKYWMAGKYGTDK